MSAPVYAITPALFDSAQASFVNATGTAGKIVVQPQPAASPGSTSPAFYGGCTVIDLIAASTDSADKDFLIYNGKILTTQDTTNTGNLTVSGQNTLSRAAGSFISDGWTVGDDVMIFTAQGTAQVTTGIDGVLCTITAVTAGALTFSGTPLASGTNVLTAASRVFRVTQLMKRKVPLNSGNTNAIANISILFDATTDGTRVTTERKLGANDALIAAAASAVTAATKIQLTAQIARY